MRRNILVTGGLGFIGSNLVKQLASRFPDASITVLDLMKDIGNWAEVVQIPNCRIFFGNLMFTEVDWSRYDEVYHLAGITDTTVADHTENLLAFHTLLSGLKEYRTPIVYASSAAVYGQRREEPFAELSAGAPRGSYAMSKWRMEQLADRFRERYAPWPITGIRYFNVYGPGEGHKGKSASMIYQLFKQLQRGQRPILFKHGEQVRDFVHVSDAVQMTIAVMHSIFHSGRPIPIVLNCGSGRAYSFNDIVSELNHLLGTNLLPEYIENAYPEFFQSYTCADMSSAFGMLQWKPLVDSHMGIFSYVRCLEKSN